MVPPGEEPGGFTKHIKKQAYMAQQFEAQYARLGISLSEIPVDPVLKGELIYRAACTKLDITPDDAPEVYRVRQKYRNSILAYNKLMVIRDGITGDREADYDNYDEEKWGGWFWMNKPGFRFGDSGYSDSGSRAGGGSRLCTFSRQDEEFFMKECIAIWADFMGGTLPE